MRKEIHISDRLLDGFDQAVGVFAGGLVDKCSLGFLAEMEYQVVKHLDGHVQRLPDKYKKSRAILEQVRANELNYAAAALDAGGAGLLEPVKKLTHMMSRIMTAAAYWI